MKILLNDEIHEVSGGIYIVSLTKELGKDDLSGWAVAINETVVPKSDLESTLLSEERSCPFYSGNAGRLAVIGHYSHNATKA